MDKYKRRLLPKFVDGIVPQLIKLDLFGKNIEWDIDRSSKSAAALIVVEDSVEAGPIAIKEVFIA